MKSGIGHIAAVAVLTVLLGVLDIHDAQARLGSGPVGSRIGVGVEMGYSQGVFSHHGFNMLSQDGYRLYDFNSGFTPSANGYLLASVSYEVSRRNVISVLGGYRGISGDDRFMTLGVRYAFHYSGTGSDGFFSLADVNAGVSTRVDIDPHPACIASFGEGYRLKLSPWVNLDFMLSLSCAFDSPAIVNPEGPGYVPEQNILSNFAGYYALNFSLSLNF